MKNGKTQPGEVAVPPVLTGGSELQEVGLVGRGGLAQEVADELALGGQALLEPPLEWAQIYCVAILDLRN